MKLNFNPYLEFQYFKIVKPFLKSLENPMESQKFLLFSILKNNQNTGFGKLKNFNKIKSIKDFQNLIKLSNYDDVKSYIDLLKIGIQFDFLKDKINYFTITSGTTTFPKFIPHTDNYINLRKKSWEVWHSITYKLKPETYSLDSSILTFTSKKKDGNTLGGQEYGSVSGKLRAIQPFFVKMTYSYPDEILEIDDFELRSYLIILFSIQKNVKLIITPNPSTLIIFAKKLNFYFFNILDDLKNNRILKLSSAKIDKNLKNLILKKFKSSRNIKLYNNFKKFKYNKNRKIYPKDIFTNLATIGCWTGGNVGFYSKKLNLYFGNNFLLRDLGLLASEGRFSTPISKNPFVGVLNINTNFYEFIEVKDYENGKFEKVKLLNEIEIDKKYYIIITNENGLYRYFMDDIIKVKSFYKKTPEIIFIQKGKYFSSITGEKVSEWEVIEVIEKILSKNEIFFHTFFVFPNNKVKIPRYEYYINFERSLNNTQIKILEKMFDEELKRINIEYKEKRETQRLANIKIKLLPKDSEMVLKKIFMKNKNHDSQIKVPKLMTLDVDINLLKENRIIK